MAKASIDTVFDIETVVSGSRLGWLINMHPVCNLLVIFTHITSYNINMECLFYIKKNTWTDPETNVQKSALSLYFIQEVRIIAQ